jgi:hypothetical protein
MAISTIAHVPDQVAYLAAACIQKVNTIVQHKNSEGFMSSCCCYLKTNKGLSPIRNMKKVPQLDNITKCLVITEKEYYSCTKTTTKLSEDVRLGYTNTNQRRQGKKLGVGGTNHN